MTTIIGCVVGVVIAYIIGLNNSTGNSMRNQVGCRHIGRSARWNRRVR